MEAAGIEPAWRMAASVVLLITCMNNKTIWEHVGSARVARLVSKWHSTTLTFEDSQMLGRA